MMQWEFVVALIIAVPLILFPAAFIWYLNVGGVYQAVRRLVARRATQKPEQATKTAAGAGDTGAERVHYMDITHWH